MLSHECSLLCYLQVNTYQPVKLNRSRLLKSQITDLERSFMTFKPLVAM
jgi:hypothetical protein